MYSPLYLSIPCIHIAISNAFYLSFNLYMVLALSGSIDCHLHIIYFWVKLANVFVSVENYVGLKKQEKRPA